MLYITGDIHGKDDFRKLSPRFFPLQNTLSGEDFLLVAGDFGLPSLPWSLNDDPYLDDLASRPYTTLFVDGNHEHHDILGTLPEVSFGGSPAGAMRDNVLHLKRGYIYTIDGLRVFAFGGAASPVKSRIGHEHDPIREIPSLAEMERACDSLGEAGWDVDLIITHTAPVRYLEAGELLTDESASFLPQRGRIRYLDVLRPSRFPEIPPEGPRLRVIRAGDRPEFPQFLRYSVDSCYPAFSPPSLRASFRILTAALKSLS